MNQIATAGLSATLRNMFSKTRCCSFVSRSFNAATLTRAPNGTSGNPASTPRTPSGTRRCAVATKKSASARANDRVGKLARLRNARYHLRSEGNQNPCTNNGNGKRTRENCFVYIAQQAQKNDYEHSAERPVYDGKPQHAPRHWAYARLLGEEECKPVQRRKRQRQTCRVRKRRRQEDKANVYGCASCNTPDQRTLPRWALSAATRA